jgi:5-methylcytosine-specific restriction endonuclease McrA
LRLLQYVEGIKAFRGVAFLIPTNALASLATIGLTAEQAAAVADMLRAVEDATRAEANSAIEARRASESARTRRYRERGGGDIPPELRDAVFKRDGFRCVYCESADHLQCDHDIPVSKGGETTLGNLVTACRVCNARKKDRDRKAFVRGMSKGNPRTSEDNRETSADTPAPNREVSPTPPLEINPTPTTSLRSVSVSAREAFDRFWSVWPNKVGRPSAERSFAKVAAEVDAIVSGVAAYVREKPADRPWLNPATFLNQRRWEDRPAAPPCGARAGPNGSKQSRLDRDADYIRKMMGTDDEPRPNQAPDFFDGPTIDAVATRVS